MKTLIISVFWLFLLMSTTSSIFSQSKSNGKSCCEDETAGVQSSDVNSSAVNDACCEEKTSAENETLGENETTAPNVMASFSNIKEFRDEHPTPLEFKLTYGDGNMITFKTSDGKDANAYEIKADKPTNNWILVFHEWYGLNDYIKREAEEIAILAGNVNVLAVDLYDGKVATNNDEAMQYVQAVDNKRAVNIILGARDYAGDSAVFGTFGWCFGGSWSNQAAIELGDKCKACVIYYGMPEQNIDRLKKQKAAVLGIFAMKDKRITTAVAKKFEEDLHSINVPIVVYHYNSVHGFANPSNPEHDAESTKDAKEKTYRFLKDRMGL
jgi:carboxymethylenebutenolidase